MEINKEIRERLKQSNLTDKLSGLAFLLARYFNIPNAECFSDKLKAEVSSLGIFTYEGSTVVWEVPLFEGQDINFEWVAEFRDKFKEVNKTRAGNLKACISRMKIFFAQNPHVRAEDVLKATDKYIASVDNPRYLCTSHYFIFKGKGADKVSLLETHLEEVMESNSSDTSGLTGINRMLD